jgi:hypothetical protein
VIRRLALVLVVLAGCAAAPRGGARGPGELSPPDEQQAQRAHDELRRLDGDLLRSDAQVTPNCQRVDQLRDNICALAVRICQIADGQPAGSATAAQCADGKARCKNAIERAQARGCPKK